MVKRKQIVAFTAAMLIAFTAVGGTVGSNVIADMAVLTASAASKITLSAKTFGLATPADSVKLYHGETLISEYSWKEFKEGISLTGANDTYLVLEYDDGELRYDASTSELISNTRKSGISREEFYITADNIAKLDETHLITSKENPNFYFTVWAFDRDKTTGSPVRYLSAKSGATVEQTEKEITNPAPDLDGSAVDSNSYSQTRNAANLIAVSTVDETQTRYTFDDIVFDYIDGADVYAEISTFSTGMFAKLNPETGEFTVINESYPHLSGDAMKTTVNTADFDVPDGYTSVDVSAFFPLFRSSYFVDPYNYGLCFVWMDDTAKWELREGSQRQSGQKWGKENFTPEEWNTIGSFSISHTFYHNISKMCRIAFYYPDGGMIEYAVIGNEAYLNDYDTSPVLLDTTDDNGNPLIKGTNDEGIPVVSDETIGTDKQQNYDYTVTIYENAEVYDVLSGADYEKGHYTIDDYSPENTYYVAVGYADSDNYRMYRFDDDLDTWEERVDTKKTPEYPLNIDLATFPDEFAGGIESYGNGIIDEWTKEEFASGEKTAVIDTKNSIQYELVFQYQNGDVAYTLIGIDPELKRVTGTKDYTPVPVDTNANVGDVIHVEGKTEDGTPVSFDVTVEKNQEDESIKLPDGDYTVTDTSTGLFDEVTADGDNDKETAGSVGDDGRYNSDGENGEKKGDKATLNLTEPETTSQYTITAPDGTPIDGGKLYDGELNHLDDINVPKDKITGTPYVKYETVIGDTNTVDPDKLKTETGYIIGVEDDGTLIKVTPNSDLTGDVNLDGKVNVKDIIMLQKHLLNVQVLENIENFINADINRDGDLDVIDLALLKRLLTAEKNK